MVSNLLLQLLLLLPVLQLLLKQLRKKPTST
jgi:hypothetical protein